MGYVHQHARQWYGPKERNNLHVAKNPHLKGGQGGYRGNTKDYSSGVACDGATVSS